MRPQWLLALVVALAAAPIPAAMPPAVGETPLPTLAPVINKVSAAGGHIGPLSRTRLRRHKTPLPDPPFSRLVFGVPPYKGPRDLPFQSAVPGVIVDAK